MSSSGISKLPIYQISQLLSQIMHKPLIVILGVTGAGKSKLALDIGQQIKGEIINADAMQMYKGLDIVTNKVTDEEMTLCPHHMIGFLSPTQQFTSTDFQYRALDLINKIHKRNRIPILVGGSNYYVQSVLWDSLITTSNKKEDTFVSLDEKMNKIRKELSKLSSLDLHRKLHEVDPKTADTIHPNDKRKILRGLEIYFQTGKRMSDHLMDQRDQNGGSSIGGPLRFKHPCVLWVQCNPEILHKRIDQRVDKMISRGLLKELSEFHRKFNEDRLESNLESDYEHGIFQSIGFKEFHDYLVSSDISQFHKNKLIDEGIERMKLSTWQYAKYQAKWIKNRIINRGGSMTLSVYPLDGSDPTCWDEMVTQPTFRVLKSFYFQNFQISQSLKDINQNGFMPEPLKCNQPSLPDDYRVLRKCEICQKYILQPNWEDHLKSKKHKKIYGLLKKQQLETVNILERRRIHLSDKANSNAEELFIENDLKLFEES